MNVVFAVFKFVMPTMYFTLGTHFITMKRENRWYFGLDGFSMGVKKKNNKIYNGNGKPIQKHNQKLLNVIFKWPPNRHYTKGKTHIHTTWNIFSLIDHFRTVL